MNGKLTKFLAALNTCNENGSSEWDDCIFTQDPVKLTQDSEQTPSDVPKNLQNFFSFAFGKDMADCKTFVLRKLEQNEHQKPVTEFSPSDIIYGNSLEFSDSLADFSINIDANCSSSNALNENSLITESKCRQLLSYLSLLLNSSCKVSVKAGAIKNLFPLTVFYKPANKTSHVENIVYISLKNVGDHPVGLIEYRFSHAGVHPSSLWRKDDVTPSSSPGQQYVCEKEGGSKSVTHFIKMHKGRSRALAECPVRVQCYAEYILFSASRMILDDSDKAMAMACVMVGITCSKVNSILSIDKKYIEDIKVMVTPVPGDMRSSAFSLFKSVQILEGFFCAFSELGEVKWTSMDEYTTEEKIQESTVDQIRQVIVSYNSEWKFWNAERKVKGEERSNKDDDETSDETTLRQLNYNRENLDFTEKIWEVLKFVGSMDDLTASFSIILEEIKEGRATQFWLHRTNQTRLAMLVQQSYKGSVTDLPELTPITCLQLLIELGLDKLLRDYTTFLITNKMATQRRLISYSGQEVKGLILGSEDMTRGLRAKFILLKKLHHVTELVAQCKEFLRLSNEQTFSITRNALQDYITEDLDFQKIFTFSVNYSEIEVMITHSLPTRWRLGISSEVKGVQHTSNISWMMEYPFQGIFKEPYSDDDSFMDEDKADSTSDVSRKYHVVTQTTSVFMF